MVWVGVLDISLSLILLMPSELLAAFALLLCDTTASLRCNSWPHLGQKNTFYRALHCAIGLFAPVKAFRLTPCMVTVKGLLQVNR